MAILSPHGVGCQPLTRRSRDFEGVGRWWLARCMFRYGVGYEA
jgi:hypothetical protein